MLTSDTNDALALAHARTRRFSAEAAANRLRTHSGARHALAAMLRRAADRLEPPSLAARSRLRLTIAADGS
jgi:hypothetical protein